VPVPLIAAAGAAPAAVSGIKSGISAVGNALGLGVKRIASGESRERYIRHCAVIDGMYAARDAAGILATMNQTTTASHSWAGSYNMSPEARAYAQTKLDQLLAANRAASGGGAPASVFGAGPGAAAGTDSYTVAGSNVSSASAAGGAAGKNLPLLIGGALALGGLGWYFMRGRRK
jgi:hypothetical protein